MHDISANPGLPKRQTYLTPTESSSRPEILEVVRILLGQNDGLGHPDMKHSFGSSLFLYGVLSMHKGNVRVFLQLDLGQCLQRFP